MKRPLRNNGLRSDKSKGSEGKPEPKEPDARQDENPNHREDFIRLLKLAASKKA
jgi:hypothetical protein